MSHCERLPNGVVVRVTKPLTADERAALTEYFDTVAARLAVHRRSLTPEEQADRAERRARLRRIQERARE